MLERAKQDMSASGSEARRSGRQFLATKASGFFAARSRLRGRDGLRSRQRSEELAACTLWRRLGSIEKSIGIRAMGSPQVQHSRGPLSERNHGSRESIGYYEHQLAPTCTAVTLEGRALMGDCGREGLTLLD